VANTDEPRRLEQSLGVARGFLAFALTLSTWLSPPAAHSDAAKAATLAYLTFSIALVVFLQSREIGAFAPRLIHGIDVIAAGVFLQLLSGRFFLSALFPIVAAAYRWALWETLATGLLVSAPSFVRPDGRFASPLPLAFADQYEILSGELLVALAVLLGYLARREKAVRAESSQAKAMDRALVARELHDGAIQSLIGMEVQVEVLRRRADRNGSAMTADLERLQELLRRETLNLRELMQQMKPLELDPKQLPDFLAETVDRFWRNTGITASFASNLEGVNLSPRICREIARIAQEALVNVRKHSGAQHVVLRLGSGSDGWKLVVDDDGHGFDFEGRLCQAELDAARKGPVIIKERVRAIGGELTIESSRGRGARLEITFPGAA